MKKCLLVVLILCMTLTLTACGGNETEKTNTDIKQSDDGKLEENKEEPKDNAPIKFVASEDLSVVAAYIYDGDTYVIVENTGDNPILDYKVAYINFDSNGFSTTTDSRGYELGRNEAANIMPGTKTQAAWYGAKGNYAVATVASITYADGTTWEATQLEAWAKEQKSQFSVEKYKESIKALEENATLAESNEYAEIFSYSIVHGNQFSSDLDLHFTISNLSSQGIVSARIFVLEFDENGFPVSVSPYDTYCLNGHQTAGTINLAAGKTEEFVNSLFIDGTTTQIKTVIAELEFQDGTTWENPYLYEWVLVNKK